MLFIISRWESGAEAVFVGRRQPAVIVHPCTPMAPFGSRRLFLCKCGLSKMGRSHIFYYNLTFCGSSQKRGAEQGNRVRIPDGNRRCKRDVRCSSTKVRHWGRTLRRQSRPAKAESCPKRESEDLQKEEGRVRDAAPVRCAHRETAVDIMSTVVFCGEGDRLWRKTKG